MKRLIGICLAMIVCCIPSMGELMAKELVFSTSAVPAAPHAQGQIKFAEEVERLTNGELVVKTYQGGELFTQEAQNTAIRRGTLDLTLLGPNWFTEYAPFMNMFATAYFFKNVEHMNTVMGGEIGSEIYDRLAQAVGVRPLSCWYLGTRQLNLRDVGKEVTTPADMDGVKLRMPNSKTWLMMGEALGANPTPVSISELYLALQTGTVDGQDNPLTTVVVRKFHEVTRYVILTGHYVNPIMPVVNEKTWQSLAPEHQQALLDAAEFARQFVEDTVVGTTDEAAQAIQDAGVEFVDVDIDVWRQHALDYYNGKQDFTSTYDTDLFEKIQSLAE